VSHEQFTKPQPARGQLPAGNRIGAMLTNSLQHHSGHSILETNR